MNHPYLEHLERTARLETAEPGRDWIPTDGPLPALYVSHGAPPLLEDAEWMAALHAWARTLPTPRAILIVSAHWESAPLALSTTDGRARLVYDFGGFDPMYSRLRYDTPDADELATLVRSVLPGSEPLHRAHLARAGPRRLGTTDGDVPGRRVPVLQLSMPTHDPARLLDLGRSLRTLREHGVLVVGSGFMTHGLPFLRWESLGTVPGWSADFDAWAADALAHGDVDELAAFRERAPGMPYAHPTVEHFTPPLRHPRRRHRSVRARDPALDGFWWGLARRSLQVA